MQEYITVYEFVGGVVLMNWFHGYVDAETNAFVQLNNKWSEIDVQTMELIRKLYKQIDQTIGKQFSVFYYEYKGHK